jgi:hypothetical protein
VFSLLKQRSARVVHGTCSRSGRLDRLCICRVGCSGGLSIAVAHNNCGVVSETTVGDDAVSKKVWGSMTSGHTVIWPELVDNAVSEQGQDGQ